MKLPSLGELIGEQMTVYEHPPDEHLFAVGPPGSGKTCLAVLRAKYLTDVGKKVILVTRNRMLAALGQQLGKSLFATTTMHSHVWTDHRDRVGGDMPQLAPYVYDWESLWKAYAAKKLAPGVDHLVIDEGQNLPQQFFQWAIKFGASHLTVFADEDQTTDENRSSIQQILSAGLPQPRRLTQNHRNTEEIALVTEHFHRSSLLPPAVIRRGRSGDRPQLVAVGDWDAIAARIVTRFKNRGGALGVVVFRKDDAKGLHARLKKVLDEDTRVDLYTSDMPKGAERSIKIFDPGITVLTSESVIGLEFNTVFLQDLSRSLPCKTPDQYRRMYMLCARARDSLILVNGPQALSPGQLGALPGPELLTR